MKLRDYTAQRTALAKEWSARYAEYLNAKQVNNRPLFIALGYACNKLQAQITVIDSAYHVQAAKNRKEYQRRAAREARKELATQLQRAQERYL